MDTLLLVPEYTKWHYGRGTRECIRNGINILWFLAVFFALGPLAQRLFSPWNSLSYEGNVKLEHGAFISVVEWVSRIFGSLFRLAMLCIGFTAIAAAMIVVVAFWVLWLFLPIILFFFFALAIKSFFA